MKFIPKLTMAVCLIFSLFLPILSGCMLDAVKNEAKFEIVYTSKGMWNNYPLIEVRVKNVGNLPAHDVFVAFYAKDAFGKILDEAKDYADYGFSIRPGTTGDCKLIFYKLKSHDDYSKLEYKITFVTEEN